MQVRVVYDTTIFVNDTIHEVIKTLVEAFALVAIVVFVFLGNLRATIVPIVAVPVSLIGTFAVLLAMGYSANTVSLLAMVLAIGIVVDDAIVVVENVERVMEEEPELSPADATKKAMAQVTAPIIAITLVLLSVFVPIGFITGISGELFRQFAVTISVAMLISAFNALTLSPALCAVFLRHSGPRRGIMGRIGRGIDVVRDGYAAIVRKTLRLSVLSIALVVVFALGIVGLAQRTPTGFLPEEDQGAFFINVQLPDGASVNRTSETVQQVEAVVQSMPQVEDVISIVGYSLLDSFSASNNAFVIARLQPFEDRTKAADGAQALIAQVFGASQQIRTATVFPFNLPPVNGLSHGRRLRVSARKSRGSGSRLDGERGPGTRCSGEPRSPSRARLLDLRRQRALALSRYRSREGAGARSQHQRGVRDVAGDARQLLHQRFQSFRSHLAGQPARRGRQPQRHLGIVGHSYSQWERHDGAAAIHRLLAHRHWPAGHHALQQLSVRHHQRQPGSWRVLRHGHGRHGGDLGENAAGRLRL